MMGNATRDPWGSLERRRLRSRRRRGEMGSWTGLGAVVLVSLVALVVVVVATAERTSSSSSASSSASRELQGQARERVRVWSEGRGGRSPSSLSQQEDPEEVLATIWKIYDYLLDQQIEFGTPFLPPLRLVALHF
jgi:hypothetical protein